MAEQTANGSMSSPKGQVTFSVVYNSPTNEPFKQHVTITTSNKTMHLKELRQANSKLQTKINEALTVRMEEDKTRGAQEGSTPAARQKKAGIDEAKEEDNYGEEVPEEDG